MIDCLSALTPRHTPATVRARAYAEFVHFAEVPLQDPEDGEAHAACANRGRVPGVGRFHLHHGEHPRDPWSCINRKDPMDASGQVPMADRDVNHDTSPTASTCSRNQDAGKCSLVSQVVNRMRPSRNQQKGGQKCSTHPYTECVCQTLTGPGANCPRDWLCSFPLPPTKWWQHAIRV